MCAQLIPKPLLQYHTHEHCTKKIILNTYSVDLLSEIIGQLIWRVISAPLVWVLATPYILVMSFFGKDTYFKNMKTYYKRIKDYFWFLKEKG